MQREQHKIAKEAVVLCLPGIAGSLQTIEIRTRHKRRQHGPAGKGNAGNLAWVAGDWKGKAETVRLQSVQFDCVESLPASAAGRCLFLLDQFRMLTTCKWLDACLHSTVKD